MISPVPFGAKPVRWSTSNWANLKAGELGMGGGEGVGVGAREDEEEEESSESDSDEGVSVAGVAAGSSRSRSRWSDGLCGWCSIWQRGGGKAEAEVPSGLE